jgi:hypothetical protein
VFVAAPALGFTLGSLGCGVFRHSNSSCSQTIASPSTSTFTLNTSSWGLSTPGSLELSDDCGGRFGVSFRNSDEIQGMWLPPTAGGLCLITGRAVNGDGAVGTTTIAVLVRGGTPPAPLVPQINAVLISQDIFCNFSNFNDQSSPRNCDGEFAGSSVSAIASANYLDGILGALEIEDDCGGGRTQAADPRSMSRLWTVAGPPGATCTVSVRATSWQGDRSVAVGRFTIF